MKNGILSLSVPKPRKGQLRRKLPSHNGKMYSYGHWAMVDGEIGALAHSFMFFALSTTHLVKFWDGKWLNIRSLRSQKFQNPLQHSFFAIQKFSMRDIKERILPPTPLRPGIHNTHSLLLTNKPKLDPFAAHSSFTKTLRINSPNE
jgi:hypothetical protein